ncbi:MAG: beta-phosphoglucomutase [Firmicutes bacterium]|nr:beta-phosphoglucomutase [Bacillota bacterium]
MKYKGVIFDLDGVIVSTDEFHFQSWKKLAQREHIDFNQEINHRLRGISRMESLDILLEKSSLEYTLLQKEEMAMYKNQIYVKLLSNLSPSDLLPNVVKTIEFLQAHHIKIAIGSSSKNTKTILKQIGLLNSFDAIVDGTDITKSKPNPEVFLKAAKKLDLLPEECMVIEDAIAGINAAKAANMMAVAIHDAVKSKHADIKIKDLYEIANFFVK